MNSKPQNLQQVIEMLEDMIKISEKYDQFDCWGDDIPDEEIQNLDDVTMDFYETQIKAKQVLRKLKKFIK